MQVENDSSHSPVIAPKKAKPSDQGSDEVSNFYALNTVTLNLADVNLYFTRSLDCRKCIM